MAQRHPAVTCPDEMKADIDLLLEKAHCTTKCYKEVLMAQTCTTSIRMDEQLAKRLDEAATKFHRRKNGIIVHAIEEYLDHHAPDLLKEKAREQSLIANQMDNIDEADAWEGAHDLQGWQS